MTITHRFYTQILPLLLLLLLLLPVASTAHGGGYPQLSNVAAGPYQVSVWTQPHPWQIGEAHLSIAVTEPAANPLVETGEPVLNAAVTVTMYPLNQPGAKLNAVAQHGEGLEQLYYEADFAPSQAGRWQIVVAVDGPAGLGQVDFYTDVKPASPLPTVLRVGAGILAALMVAAWLAERRGLPRPVIAGASSLIVILTLIGGSWIVYQATPKPLAIQHHTEGWLTKFQAAPNPEITVDVLASQWAWDFAYAEGRIRSDTLRLPQGRVAQLTIHTDDTLHSFSIPDFQLNEQIIPGRPVVLHLTPTTNGSYVLTCEAICGAGYADMLASIEVLPAATFDSWLNDARQQASRPQTK